MRFTVTYEDGTSVEVSPAPTDVLTFEDDNHTTLRESIASGSPRWTYQLAWLWLTRKTDEGRKFDAWLNTVESIKTARDDDPAKPAEGDADPTSAATDTSPSPES